MGTKIDRICETCHKTFETSAYEVRRGKGRYCSAHCFGVANAQRLNTYRKPHTRNRSSFVAGQTKGSNNAKWVEPIKRICDFCHTEFLVKPWHLNMKDHKYRFCSKQCNAQYRKQHEAGEKSPFWVGGPKTYRGRGWRKLRLTVVGEQNGTCAKCGKYVGDSLPVHHIRPYREFDSPSEANHRSNLIGLCQSCHMRQEYSRLNLEHMQGGV